MMNNNAWTNELEILKLLSEKTNDGLWLMDTQLKTVYMSPAIEHHMGYTPEEYIALPIHERLPADALKIYQENYQKLLYQFKQNPKNDSIIFELPHRHKNGNSYWGEVSVRIIQDENHNILGFAGVTRNTHAKHVLQEELAESNAYYKAILDGFTGLVYVCSEDYIVEFMNEAFIKRTGRNAVGELCYKALHNLDERCSFCVNEEVLKNRKKVEWEILSPFDNRWYHVINVPLDPGKGKLSKLALITDITEKKESLEKLNESESLFRQLAEYSPSAIFIYQGNTFAYANTALEKLVGYTNEELLQLNFWDVVAPDHREFVKQRGLKRQEGAAVENRYEFKIITKNGEEKWIDFAGAFIQYKGKPAAIGTAFDITKIKETETQIRKSEEKYRNLFELAADGIAIFNEQGLLLDVNSKIEDIFSWKKEHIVGKNISNFLASGQADQKPLRFDLLNEGKTVIGERTFVHATGRELTIETHAKKMPDNSFHVFIRDISQRRQMEKELARSEEHFRSLVELAVDGIIIGDTAGIVVGVNKRFLEIAGKKQEEIIGKHISALFPTEVLASTPLDFTSLKTGLTLVKERELVKPNGDRVIIEMHSKMMPDGSYQSFIRDITERRKTEDALIHSRNLFNTVFDNSQNPIFIINDEGYYTDLNKAACDFLETSKEEITGQHVTVTLPDKNPDPAKMETHKQLWVTGGMIETSYLVNNTVKTLLLSISPVIHDNKRHIFGIGTDITFQKKYLAALSESEEKFRQMSENIADGITIIENGKAIYTNPSLSEITGYSEEDLKKMTGLDLAAPWEKERIRMIHSQARNDKSIVNYLEYCIITKNGKEKYLMNRYSVGTTNPNRHYIITTDITDRKRFEKELLLKNEEIQKQNQEYRKLNDELQISIEKARESDRLKSAFIANMSHEIRTPLNAIMGFSDMLIKKELTSGKIKSYSKIIHNSGNHLLNLISDIIDISKIETGQMDLTFDPINLNELFGETHTAFSPMAAEKQLILRTDVPAAVHHIVSDRTKLQQILNNLIANALKFTEFGEVVFGFRITGKNLEIFVSDTGIGIANKEIPLIFERFRQLEQKQGTKYPGTGLGLAIVKGLTELMKGNIHVTSALGKGSEFRLEFPVELSEEKKEDTGIAELGSSAYNFTGKKLLLAEDETLSRMLFTEIIQSTGIGIIEAKDGEEALTLFAAHQPDIIILDLGLPRMDGIQVCREIRKQNTQIPVIACSAYAYSSDKENAKKAGCNDFISKPYQSEQLVLLIDNHLNKK